MSLILIFCVFVIFFTSISFAIEKDVSEKWIAPDFWAHGLMVGSITTVLIVLAIIQ